MKSWPRISVVVPSFNQGKYLGETLSSIFDQGYPNLEVVVMDGGSTDHSVSIIQSYAHRLTYWQSRPDQGQAHAINEGMGHCTGELVTWLNSDDFYCGDSLWIVARSYLKFPDHGLYVGNGYRFSQNSGEKTPFCPTHLSFNRVALAEGLDYIQQPSTFILRQAWNLAGGLNLHLHYGLDWDLFIRVAEKYPVVLINEFLSASREYRDTKTGSGRMKRALELIRISQERSGKQITLGASFYLLGTMMELTGADLPASLHPPLSDAVHVLRREMSRSWGGEETFPVHSDEQDKDYLPFPSLESPPSRPSAPSGPPLPLLSMVIFSREDDSFLPKALESIIQQGYGPIQIIVASKNKADRSSLAPPEIAVQISFCEVHSTDSLDAWFRTILETPGGLNPLLS